MDILNLNCYNNYYLVNNIKCYTKSTSISIIDINICEACGNNYSQLNENVEYYYNSQLNCSKSILCYYSCKTCNKEGNKEYHNCIECKDDYYYSINISNYLNCYNISEYHHSTEIIVNSENFTDEFSYFFQIVQYLLIIPKQMKYQMIQFILIIKNLVIMMIYLKILL